MSKTLKLIFTAFIFISLATGCSGMKEDDVFVDQRGKELRLSDLKGKVVLMDFILTSCPNKKCDLITLQLLRTQLHLKDRIGKDLFLVSISIDPENDSPKVLGEYAERFKADSQGWYFLTGSPDATDRLRKKYDVKWKTASDGTRHHRVVIALLNRKGETASVYNDYNYDTLKIVEDIKGLLEEKI